MPFRWNASIDSSANLKHKLRNCLLALGRRIKPPFILLLTVFSSVHEHAWLIAERIFKLFVWGAFAASIAALGRKTDDELIRAASIVLFSIHGWAMGVTLANVWIHSLEKADMFRFNRVKVLCWSLLVGGTLSLSLNRWLFYVISALLENGLLGD